MEAQLTASTIETIQGLIVLLPLVIGLPVVLVSLFATSNAQTARPIEIARAVNQRAGGEVMRMMTMFVIVVNLAIIAIINL